MAVVPVGCNVRVGGLVVQRVIEIIVYIFGVEGFG